MHLDAALYFLCEQRREPLADLAAVEDVGVDVDVVARCGHRLEHRPMGARPVHQQARLVAADERIVGRGALRRRTRVGRRERASRQGRQQRRENCAGGEAAEHLTA